MFSNLKDLFDSDADHLKVDNRFVEKLHKYERNFVNKNEDNIVFLGGVLMGTPRFIYSRADRVNLFDEVLEIDEVPLKQEINKLPTVNKDHKVASDALNLTVAYIVHRLYTSGLSGRKMEEGLMAILKIMHYRFLSSLMSNYFKYEPDKAIMEATYYALNRKFSLKQEGSWAALIEQRCKDIIDQRSIHRKTLELFRDDDKIQYFITDTQGRIREVVKKMYRVFLDVHQNSAKILVRKDHIELEGEMHVRDLIRDTSRYKRYVHEILGEKATFIKDELIQVVGDAIHTAPPRHINTVLEYMVDNYGRRGDKRVAELVDETLVHAFQYIAENRSEFRGGTNLSTLLARLKMLYMSSRTTDQNVIKMRDLSFKISKKAIKTSNSSLLSSVRTAVMLYIVLRTFSMNHYS